MIKPVFNSGTDEPRFSDGKNVYSRIVAGVGWPSHGGPGCFCVLGEAAGKHRVFDKPVVRVLDEGLDVLGEPLMDCPTVFKAMAHALEMDMALRWFAMPGYSVSDLSKFNRSRLLSRQHRIAVSPPPQLEERGFAGYLSMIRARVAGTKTLFFGDHRIIPSALSGLPADIDDIGADRSPAITALACALAGMDLTSTSTTRGVHRTSRGADAHSGY